MMDNLDRLLDAIEHPGKYPDEELNALLSDHELRRAYRLMAASRSSMIEQSDPDVDSEWQRFSARHLSQRKPFVLRLIGRRPVAAAAIAALVSLAAVAAGITITKRVNLRDKEVAETVQAYDGASDRVEAIAFGPDSLTAQADSAAVSIVTFKDETLVDILAAMGRRYGLEVEFKNPDARRLRLYFNWNPAISLEETVEQLNNFEQINISLRNNKLIVY